MRPGEAFSLKAVARLINAMGYDRVVICDPHSDVAPALVDRVEVVSQLDLVRAHAPLSGMLSEDIDVIVSPDAGAAKKAHAVARHCGLPQVVASKVRDTRTGEITSTELQDPALVSGRAALIVDDICDGGRTFVELAGVLRTAGATHVYLYVTHGIFSKGFGVFRGLIDGIYTTDSFSGSLHGNGPVPLRVSPLKFNTRGIVL
jgi:ribose-phosphate pyrophosphokinase